MYVVSKLAILDRFDPIWWKKKLSFLSSCNKALFISLFILLTSISVQNLTILLLWTVDSCGFLNQCVLVLLLQLLAVILRHTIKTAVKLRRTAENCGFLNHLSYFPVKQIWRKSAVCSRLAVKKVKRQDTHTNMLVELLV